MSPAKKAAVKARLARVRPNKGGGGKSKPKGKALTRTASNPKAAATTNNNNRKPRGGATYQAIKVTGEAAMPLTDYVLRPDVLAGRGTVDKFVAHVKERANMELAKGYAVAAADFGVSKHRFVRHANALSRLSVTALTPEGYNLLKTYEDVRAGLSAQDVHDRMAQRLSGYSPKSAAFGVTEETRTYHKLKWGLAAARLLANRTRIGRALTRPIRENVLKELGGSV